MSDEVLFTEKQWFRQWWLCLVLLGLNVPFLFEIFKQVAGKQQFDNNPMYDKQILFSFVGIFFISLLVLCCRLETTIKQDGIYIRFFPFHLKTKYYSWDIIKKSYIRQYSPLAEYGGWGIRIGLFVNGAAYNVSGNKGLQLEFTNNKKLLIGTNKTDELIIALNKVGKLKQ